MDLVHLNYTYDRNSNRLSANDAVAAALSKPFDWTYDYDGLNRLIDAVREWPSSRSGGAAFRQTFGLDATGNWSTFNQDDDGTAGYDLQQTRTHNKMNEITGIAEQSGQPQWVAPTYDPAGNTIIMPKPRNPQESYTATYDAWNRLVRIQQDDGKSGLETVAEYEYDGRNFRTVA